MSKPGNQPVVVANWRRNAIFRKYATLLLALVGGGLLLSGLVEMYFSYQDNKRTLARIQWEKARSAASVIEQYIEGILTQIAWTRAT